MADLLWDAEVGPGRCHGPWAVLHRILTGRGHLTNNAHEVQLSALGGLVQCLVEQNEERTALLMSSFYTRRWISSGDLQRCSVDVVASGGAETSHGGQQAAFASLCASCLAREIPPLERLPTHNAALFRSISPTVARNFRSLLAI